MDRLGSVWRRRYPTDTEGSGARAAPQEAAEGATPLSVVVGAEVEFALTKDPRVSVGLVSHPPPFLDVLLRDNAVGCMRRVHQAT